MQMTEADDTPYLYRQWSAISLVAGALERRVWTIVGRQGGLPRRTYPNLYVLLIGAPGVGKFIVNTVRELWRNTKEPGSQKLAFHVGDSNMTKASMLDGYIKCIRSFLPPNGSPYEYNSMLIAAEEFGVFLPSNDTSFIAMLNDIYNAPDFYSETRRHGPAKEVHIDNPILNILGGAQPVWMKTIFPEEAWGMGLFSRIIMVYATSGEPIDPFGEGFDRPIVRQQLVNELNRLSILYGELKWSEAARRTMTVWHVAGGPPAPTHSKLEHYCRRRTQHAIKLALVSAVSRTGKCGLIEEIDVVRAIAWLTEAEKLMPDIFRAMIGQSDHDVIEELYRYMVNMYATNKRQPIHERFLVMFLSRRVPSDKVFKIIEAAERSGMITRIGGTETYRPNERKDFVE